MIVKSVLFLAALVVSGAAFAQAPVQLKFGELLVSYDGAQSPAIVTLADKNGPFATINSILTFWRAPSSVGSSRSPLKTAKSSSFQAPMPTRVSLRSTTSSQRIRS